MTPNSVSCDDALKSVSRSVCGHQYSSLDCSSAGLDMLKRDRFELLSAYLDGEVTAAERREVEALLATDPVAQCLHQRLLRLRQELRSMPCPVVIKESKDQLVGRVLARTYHRTCQLLVWGGMTAALILTSLVSLQWDDGRWSPQVTTSPQDSHSATNPALPDQRMAIDTSSLEPSGSSTSNAPSSDGALMVALNRPVIAIPKARSSGSEANHRSGSIPDFVLEQR